MFSTNSIIYKTENSLLSCLSVFHEASVDKSWVIRIINEEINLIDNEIKLAIQHQNVVKKISAQMTKEALIRLMKKIQDSDKGT